MAIKAIINNTEKEIEQIKNSDEQDIDYVYSRIGDTEVEGEPPISIKSIGGELADCRIYGQTSRNLFDGELEQGYYKDTAGSSNDLISTNLRVAGTSFIPVSAGNKMTLSYESAIDITRYLVYYYNNNKELINVMGWYNNGFTITIPDNVSFIRHVWCARDKGTYGTILVADIFNIMLNMGSTALPYEPYGESVGDLVTSGEHAGEYKVPVTVEGKNLWDEMYNEDRILHYVPIKVKDGEYTLSTTIPNAGAPGGSPAANIFFLAGNVNSGASSLNNGCWFNNPQTVQSIDGYVTIAYKATESFGEQCDPWNNETMLNEGSTPLPYEPYHAPVTTPIYLPEQIKMVGDDAEYIDYAEQKMHRVRKNELKNTAASQSINGLTFMVNTDKSITVNGTATEITKLFLGGIRLIKNVPYKISGCPSGGSTNTYRLDPRYTTGSVLIPFIDTGNGSVYTSENDITLNIYIYVRSGYTCNNLTFYPMIRKADIEDDTYEPYIPNTELDVTLPALSTIKGTNTFSVNTSIQPSNIYVKDNFDYKKIFTATRTIEGESPLNYRSIEDSDSTLSNYRIYGNTVGGESVGDRTANLFDGNFLQGYWAYADGKFIYVNTWICTNKIPCTGSQVYTYSFSNLSRWTGFVWYDADGNYISTSNRQDDSDTQYRLYFAEAPSNAAYMVVNIAGYPSVSATISPSDVTDFMLVEGSIPFPYEPYGYKVPVTVSNGTDTLTTPIYLPEQIRKVGDEAEYIDYGEQKQHRVRKNLLENTATSQTVKGVTFTVNADGSITCSGILTSGEYADLVVSGVFLGDTDILENGNYVVSCANGSNDASLLVGNSKGEVGRVRAAEINISANLTWAMLRIRQADPAITLYPMIRKASIADDTYEPYIENTDLDVTLPALPTLPGTNVLSVDTEAQPSDIYLKGKIKKKPKIYYKIYYYSQDGQTALSTETVEEGHDCTYSTVPTKESDTDFDYIFTGWSTSTNSTTATAGATENIQQNTNLYAAFSTDTISDSWEEIIANCDNGTYASKYQIGDLKTIDVGTEGPVQMQIVAIDTDLLASDNTKKAPITWISKQLLNTYKAMHSTSSNYLSDWTNCDMRTYLRGTILPMLPSVVQNGIKEVTKYTCKRTSSTTYTTVSTTENIWLPSYREVSYYTSNCETSGVQYNSIFTNDYASQRIKLKVGEAEDDAYYWWTRSASGDSLSVHQFYFALVGRGGYTDYIGWDCTSFGGVAIGFCT